jgi:hypothetical protein
MIELLMNNELEWKLKEALVVSFDVLNRYLTGGTEENHKTLSRDSRSPGRDLNPEPPKDEVCFPLVRNIQYLDVDGRIILKYTSS